MQSRSTAQFELEILDKLAGLTIAWHAFLQGSYSHLISTKSGNEMRFAIRMEALAREFSDLGYSIPSQYAELFPTWINLEGRYFERYVEARIDDIFSEAKKEISIGHELRAGRLSRRYHDLVQSYQDLGFEAVDFVARIKLRSQLIAGDILQTFGGDAANDPHIDVRAGQGSIASIVVYLPKRLLNDFVNVIGTTNIHSMETSGLAPSLPGMKDLADVERIKKAQSMAKTSNVVKLR